MARVILIHWNEEESTAGVAALRRAGFQAERLLPKGSAGLRTVQAAPPDAFVIDLGRLPLQGQAVAVELRKRKATRATPLVFAGGAPEKVERVKRILPDAVFTDWERISGAVRDAIAHPPAAPVTPGTMDAYSGTPLDKKLGIKPDSAVLLIGAPPDFALPGGRAVTKNADRVLLFVRSAAELGQRFRRADTGVRQGGGLWIVWPKKASGIATDLSERVIREYGLGAGWVDYKICAVDATWSGLLFARRANAG